MSPVAPELVDAALRAAQRLDRDVADVPVLAIAREAGISRSTLLRRLGGSRQALDDAVRTAGFDPGGQRPVRERAVAAGAALISEDGLAALTLEAVASSAHCSVPGLYATFGGRDGLLLAIYERYSPILDLEAVLADPDADLGVVVRDVYRLVVEGVSREPRVVPAILADVLSRPGDSVVRGFIGQFAPRVLSGLGQWLSGEVAAGRIRDLPLPLLTQQMIGPVLVHVLMRPAVQSVPALELPGIDDSCQLFAENFLRAVGLPGPR